MTSETRIALDRAIAEHFATESEGAMVTGYVLQIIGTTVDDLTSRQFRHQRLILPDQNAITTLGITEWLYANIKQSIHD